LGSVCTHPLHLPFRSGVWNDCQGEVDMLRVNLLFEKGVVTTSPTSHSNSPQLHPPLHRKPLKAPRKNQKSRTPWARPTPALTPAPALRIRFRAGSWSAACWHPVLSLFLTCVWNGCQEAGGKLRVHLLFENVVVTISSTSHSNSPLPHPPPHQKPLKTPYKNQKSRTP